MTKGYEFLAPHPAEMGFKPVPMQVKVKKLHPNAVIPQYAKPGDAGMDLTAVWVKHAGHTNKPYSEFGTGLSIEIPEGYVGLIFPRSSISKTVHSLANSVGVVDSGYRGEITFRFFANGTAALYVEHLRTGVLSRESFEDLYTSKEGYEVGDKIGQLIILPYPQIEFVEAEELSKTERGTNGYGHTGR